MSEPLFDHRTRISRHNPDQLRQFVKACYRLVGETYPDVTWSYIIQMASDISQGKLPTNIISLQIHQIVHSNSLILDPFNAEDIPCHE